MGVSTVGEHPWVYSSGTHGESDTTFHFRVCDGVWDINPIYFGQEYSVFPEDSILVVEEVVYDYYMEFTYGSATGISTEEQVPQSFYVNQNYPNPFNPATTIEFGLPAQMDVKIDIFSLDGRKVGTLVDGKLSAGMHKANWDARRFSSGMYFYRVVTSEQTITKRLLLIK